MKSQLELSLEAFEALLKRVQEQHSKDFDRIAKERSNLTTIEQFCYDKDEVDKAMRLLSKTARMFRKANEKAYNLSPASRP